jgi:long-subunit acyl-CoA synthetase (AMP-forming)
LKLADGRYFKQEALTKEAITEDGWFKTGDIGQWESDGTLSIIDRIKNLVKLQNGEYIALDRLESIYKACGRSLPSSGADDRCRPVHLYLRTTIR